MIVIGSMNITTTRDRGNFQCPKCRTPQPYRLRARRPFLTLYWIPVIPIGGAELSVKCDGCRSTWDETVLTMDTHPAPTDEQMFRDEAIRSAVLVVLSDGVISENEIEALLQIANVRFDRSMDREELGELCSIAMQNKIQATDYVLTISRGWSFDQRTRALQAMFIAASANGALSAKQVETLATMCELLEFSQSEYESAIEATFS